MIPSSCPPTTSVSQIPGSSPLRIRADDSTRIQPRSALSAENSGNPCVAELAEIGQRSPANAVSSFSCAAVHGICCTRRGRRDGSVEFGEQLRDDFALAPHGPEPQSRLGGRRARGSPRRAAPPRRHRANTGRRGSAGGLLGRRGPAEPTAREARPPEAATDIRVLAITRQTSPLR